MVAQIGVNAIIRSGLVAAAFVTLCVRGAHAQQPVAPRPEGPGTLVGLVVDSLGRPVVNATVYILSPRRTTVTRPNGTFRFDSLPNGKYVIGARAIGYISSAGEVPVTDKGGVAIIQVRQFSTVLPSVSTTATRTGLSGVIADTAYKALDSVTVQAVGSGVGSTMTNSKGEFYLPVKPGDYIVRIERPGYAYQLIGITVPPNEGRRMAAWMAPQDRARSAMEGKVLYEMRERLIRRTAVSSKLYTHAELKRLNIRDALDGARRFFGREPHPWDCAYINGGPESAPLWAIDADEIEAFELYGERGGKTPAFKDPFKCTHFVWLRK